MEQVLETLFLEALEKDKHRLLRLCSVYAENDDEKKDLFQEALINIWESMSSFKNQSSLSTWMYRVTLNVCMRLRTQRIKRRKLIQHESEEILNYLKSEEKDHSRDDERLVQLRSCIQVLNEADKAIITLFLENLPYQEIALIIGLTENHVAVKIKRIKNKLLNCMTQKK